VLPKRARTSDQNPVRTVNDAFEMEHSVSSQLGVRASRSEGRNGDVLQFSGELGIGRCVRRGVQSKESHVERRPGNGELNIAAAAGNFQLRSLLPCGINRGAHLQNRVIHVGWNGGAEDKVGAHDGK